MLNCAVDHILQYFYTPELEFLKRLWGLGTEEEEGYRTGPPGYIAWRNSFLGIDSGAPYTFKNTSSDSEPTILLHHPKQMTSKDDIVEAS
jgi:hypothetical protein